MVMLIMSIRQRKIKIEPRIKLNHNTKFNITQGFDNNRSHEQFLPKTAILLPSCIVKSVLHCVFCSFPPQLTVTTLNGASGRPARIHVDPGSWSEAEHAPILLRQAVDSTAHGWGDPCKAHSVTLLTVQVKERNCKGVIYRWLWITVWLVLWYLQTFGLTSGHVRKGLCNLRKFIWSSSEIFWSSS